jgi:hypothetical protein
MMDDKNKKGSTPFTNGSASSYDDDKFYNLDTAASSTDCTGLIPTPPMSVDEEESYADLHSIPKVKNKVNNGLQQEKIVPPNKRP